MKPEYHWQPGFHAGQHVKLCRRVLPALIASCFACSPAWANPTGAQVVTGQVNISNNGNVLTVTNSPGSIINWQSFSINPGELTQFLQQSSSSAVLNRIVGQDPSQIFGALQSNGKVYLINPNGILFGAGSQVNVGGLVASSLNISNADFTAGKNNFASLTPTSSAGAVTNQGSIITPSGGQIYLIAPQVQNTGILTSPQGEVLLAAGHSVQLVDGGDPNIQVVVSAPTDQALNLGQVLADGGKIGIYGALVNQNGIVSADSAVVGQNGEIVFKSSQATLLGGNSVTSATGAGTGGSIYVLGPQVGLTDYATINASGQTGGGTVLVGGDFHGANPAIMNANTVTLGANTSINADAIQNGNGGRIAVWSLDSTLVAGNISAKGGALSGNGGYVETSGAQLAIATGTSITTAATHGKVGSWLLDPDDFNIASSGGDLTGAALSGFLANNSVTIDTTASGVNSPPSNFTGTVAGSGLGNINVSDTVSWNSGYSLTLNAAGGISITSPITNTGGGTLALNAVNSITQSAAISVPTLSAISTAGAVTLTSANAVNSISGSGVTGFQFNNTAPGGTLTVAGITSTNSPITVTEGSTGGITISGPVDSGGALITLTATNGPLTGGTIGGTIGDSAVLTAGTTISGLVTGVDSLTASAPGGVDITNTAPSGLLTIPGSGITSTNNSILLEETGATGITVTGTINAGGGEVSLTADNGAITTTSGTITTSGTGFVSLTAYGNLALGSITTDTTNGNVYMTSTNGKVTGGTITTSYLQINADTGIGTAGTPLATSVGSLNLYNSGGGDIAVANTGLPLTAVVATQGAAGNVYISNNMAMTAGNGEFGISVQSGGNVGLKAGGAIDVATPISAAGGTVALYTTSGDITQEATITANAVSAVATAGSVTLTDEGNLIGTIAGSSGGPNGFTFENNQSFTVGSVAQVGSGAITVPLANGITATGATATYSITMQTPTTGDITIAGPVNGGSLDVLINSAGALYQGNGGSITTTGGLVLDAGSSNGIGVIGTPLVTNVGTISYIYSGGPVYINNTGTSTLALDGIEAYGEVKITTAGPLTIPTGTGGTDFSSGGNITLASAGAMNIAGGNIFSASGGSDAITLYAGFTSALASASNGSNSALVTNASFQGSPINLWANNASNFSGSATFSTTPIYHVATAAAAPTTIDVTVTGETAGNKTYDGTTTATLTGGSLAGVASGDDVVLVQSGSFSSKNVGTGIGVTATDTLNIIGDTSGDTYVLIQPTGLSANITPAILTVSGQSAGNKIYNGNTAAILAGGSLSGVIAGDAVTLVNPNTGVFASKNVGTNIAVTASDSLSGADAGNYTLVQPALAANITPATLTLSGTQIANNKTYDGTTAATLSGGTLSGVIGNDSVTLIGSGSFATKNVGTNIPVTVQDVVGGADGGNYIIAQPTITLAANITPLPITVTATGSNKVYNGSVNDIVTLNGVGVVLGDNVSFTDTSASFANANVGTGKAVTVSGITATGADAGNYSVNGSAVTSANITPATLTVIGEIGQNKVYDGTTAATLVGGTLSGLISSDNGAVLLTQAGNFASSNVGNGIAITAADSLSGSAAGNYTLIEPTGLSANIVGATVVTQSTPTILASNSYIIALNTETTTLLSGGTNTTTAGGTTGGSSTTGSSTSSSGTANNGNVKKLYCN